jgi:hypothetical protein
MIAAVKGWHAGWAALLFCLQPGASAADDLAGAARELARRTVAFTGRGEPVSVAWRNVSSLGSAAFSQARGAFETAVRDAGDRVTEVAPVAELHLTLSENQTQFLMVEEARKGDDRQVWIATWKRAPSTAAVGGAQGVTLEKKLVFEQAEPILDAVFPEGNLLVLSPAGVALYTRQNGQWDLRQSVPLLTQSTQPKPWPRDLRGHLRLHGNSFQVYLPGMACAGTMEPAPAVAPAIAPAIAPALAPAIALTIDCRPSDEPWVLESGSRAMLLAALAPARNYFDGRVTTQTGAPKTVAPFFSAAAVEDQDRQLWLLAMLDGHTQIVDASFEPLGGTAVLGRDAAWGSDMAGTEAHCGGGSQVLVTKAGDGREADSLRAYSVRNRVPEPLTEPLDFSGPVTALWSSVTGAGAGTVLAVARDAETGRFGAYLITVNCGP